MTGFPRAFLLSSLVAASFVSNAGARLFEPLPAPPKLEADAQTVGVWEFGKAGFDRGEVLDVAGKAAAGKLLGKWAFVTPPELGASYPGAVKILAGRSDPRSEVRFPSLSEGAFSIDVVLRWERGGGMFLRIGPGDAGKAASVLSLGVLQRGPGKFELRVPVKTPDGKLATEILSSLEIYNAPEVGPVRFDEFYTYSFTYDGRKTFRLYVNGREVFEGAISTGVFAPASSELAVGDVLDWNDVFIGEIAAVRVTRGVRNYQPVAASPALFEKKSTSGWSFDAGPVGAPVAAGSIALFPSDLYSPERGFGWMQTPKDGFDSWYMPGSFAGTPKASLANNEHKILDPSQRDGLALGQGDLFRVDVPDGKYWVAIELGHNLGQADIASVSANGSIIAKDLLTNMNLFGGTVSERMARGLVSVTGGQGIVLGATAEGPVPIKSIGILPYAPLPISRKDNKLVWTGSSPAPASFADVSKAFAQGDLKGATAAASRMENPFLQACALSFVLGYPKLPEPSDVLTAVRVRELLIEALNDEPKNTAARWLFDSNERFRHALTAYIDERGTEAAFGSRFVLPFHTANLGFSLTPDDPEYWQAKFLSAAALWQAAVQGSAFTGLTTDEFVPGKGYKAFPAPGRFFREVISAWPEFRIARIMLGEKLPVATDWKAPANAPEWAALEYPLMQRILEVLAYWVKERMDARGLLGGGLGDDVEALRWWSPAVLLASDPTTIDGWRRLAETAWESTMGTGYATGMDDVEHSAEPTSDPLPMLALINLDTDAMPKTLERLTRTTGAFRDVWTAVDPQGYRMFKGHHLSAKKIERDGDVPYNVRAIRPLIWASWVARGKYPDLDTALVEYARSWLDATMAEIDGKPAGLPPMMIMPGRQKVRLEKAKDWVFPGYWSYEYPSGYVPKIYELLLAAYEISGDKKFLAPARFALEALGKIPVGNESAEKYQRPSFEWALRIGAPMLGNAGANYRLVTGDRSFDDVLLRFGPSLTRFQILSQRAKTDDERAAAFEPVTTLLSKGLAEMNSNPELRTVMVKSTDRIYVFGSSTISSYATGMPMSDADLRGNEVIWPMFAITWEGTQGSVSALVQDASSKSLDVLLYNFADQPRKLTPRVWRLQPGDYDLVVSRVDRNGVSSGGEVSRQTVNIQKAGQQVPFELPPGVPIKLSLIPK